MKEYTIPLMRITMFDDIINTSETGGAIATQSPIMASGNVTAKGSTWTALENSYQITYEVMGFNN